MERAEPRQVLRHESGLAADGVTRKRAVAVVEDAVHAQSALVLIVLLVAHVHVVVGVVPAPNTEGVPMAPPMPRPMFAAMFMPTPPIMFGMGMY